MGFVLKSVSPIQMFKGVNLVIGIISLGIGLFSYFQSTWVKYNMVYAKGHYYGFIMPNKICEIIDRKPSNFLKACPNIAWERVFVSVIMICFVLSLISFVLEFIERVNLKKKSFRIVDTVCHLLAVIALVVTGVLYIFSALLIYDILDLENAPDYMPEHKFRTVEKMVSAVFVFFQAAGYAATAYQLRK